MATVTKIPFRTAYNNEIEIHTPSGERTRPIYEYEVNAEGKKVLVVTGEENVYEKIQSHLEGVLIETILSHLAVGDKSDFRPNGIYEDITKAPKNMIEAMQINQKVENLWRKQPLDVKAKFNNSIEEFKAKAGTEAWLNNMGFIQPNVITPKAENEVPKTTAPVPNPASEGGGAGEK